MTRVPPQTLKLALLVETPDRAGFVGDLGAKDRSAGVNHRPIAYITRLLAGGDNKPLEERRWRDVPVHRTIMSASR